MSALAGNAVWCRVLSVIALVLLSSGAVAEAGDVAAARQSVRAGLYLVMVDDPACPHCRRWDREVGVSYDRTPEGRRAPLVRRRIGDRELQGFRGLAYTPTFILVSSGREIGRIVGYAGADFFWQELGALLRKAGIEDDLDVRRS